MLIAMLLPFLVITFIVKLFYQCRKKAKSLKGQHVCITGGSSGIGKYVGILASKLGAHVTLIARDKQRLEVAANEVEEVKISNSQKIQTVSLDCSNHDAVIQIIQTIDADLPIYMFVNCAGIAICGRFEEMTKEDIRKVFDNNYFSTAYTLKAVIPKMMERNEGILVITSSQGGLFGIYGYSIYASAKFALRGLAETLHMELKDHNVSVTLALPPDTDTPGFANENKSKPRETKMISEAAGLFQPEIVAKQLIKDALNGNFFSSVGFESWILTTLCVGMSPFNYMFDVILQGVVLGMLRVVSSFYIMSFQRIISKCFKERNVKKVD